MLSNEATPVANPDTPSHEMNSAVTSTHRLRRQVCMVIGAGLGLASGFAPVYFATLSVFLKPVAAEFAWGRAQTAMAGVLSMLGLAIGSVLMGRLIDRFGALPVILASILSMSGLIALLALAPNNSLLFAGLSFLIGFTGAATTPPGYLSVLAQWFNRRLGLALGLAGVLMGGGTIVMPIIAQGFIAANGWRQAYVSLALAAAICGVVACMFVFVHGGNDRSSARREAAPPAEHEGDTVAQAFCTTRFWLLGAIVFLVSAASLGTSVHLVSLITDHGVPAATAAKAAALSGVGVLLGRLVSGVLLDIYAARHVAAGTFFLAGLGALNLGFDGAGGFASTAASVLLIGFAIGAEGDFIPFFVRRYFGLTAFGSIYGLLFFAFGVGGVLGPIAFGACFDRLGSYSAALSVAGFGLVACAVGISQLGAYRFGTARAHG